MPKLFHLPINPFVVTGILLLTVCLLSCGQAKVNVKDKSAGKAPLSYGQPKPDVKGESADEASLADSDGARFAEKKAALDQLFLLHRDSAAFSSQDIWTSLSIGHLFSNVEKDAVLRYNDNDTVMSVIVLRQSGSSWDTIFSTKIWPAEICAFDEKIEISDFNGDDIPDLKITKIFWELRVGEIADLWLYDKHRFTKVAGFDNIVSAIYDKRTNLIYSYHSNGCADMAMYFGVFRIKGNAVESVKEMFCNCCLESNDSCSIEVMGKKPYQVPYEKAYKHVPAFYADAVKAKCGF